MLASVISINNLADDSLAHIFAFLPPDERVRLERVCRHWGHVAKKHAWPEFRTLNGQELAQQSRQLALPKYRALISRCGTYLRELLFVALGEYNVDQWTMLRNLRHLRQFFGSK